MDKQSRTPIMVGLTSALIVVLFLWAPWIATAHAKKRVVQRFTSECAEYWMAVAQTVKDMES